MAQLSSTSLLNDANLVAYYKLEDATDSKGTFTLANTGGATFTGAKYANGANLGAANNSKYIGTTNNLGLNGNGDMSVSLWAKALTEISSGLYEFVEHQSTSSADRYIAFGYQFNSGTPGLLVTAASSLITYNFLMGTVAFHHLVVTRNVAGNAAILYVDSAPVGTTTLGAGTGGVNSFNLGANIAPNSYSSALLDDVGVFSRVLTPAEVITLYTDVSSGLLGASEI